MGMRRVLSLGQEKYYRDKTVQSAYRDIYLISGTQTCCLDPTVTNQRERERERRGLCFSYRLTDPLVPCSTHTRAHPRYRVSPGLRKGETTILRTCVKDVPEHGVSISFDKIDRPLSLTRRCTANWRPSVLFFAEVYDKPLRPDTQG